LDEADHLIVLLDACFGALANIGERQEALAAAIRETCRCDEARLQELGVVCDRTITEVETSIPPR
jgi:hypothetical protein